MTTDDKFSKADRRAMEQFRKSEIASRRNRDRGKTMTITDFMQGQEYRMPPTGRPCPGRCKWKLLHCDGNDWDGYECEDCKARFTERCSFDDEFS